MSRYLIFGLFSLSLSFINCNQPVKTESSHSIISSYKTPIKMFAFNEQSTIWLTTKNNTLLRGDNGGESWVTVDSNSFGFFKAMTFATKYIGWAVNDKGQVWGTKDTGNTWELLSTLNDGDASFVGPIEEIQFIDDSNGWILTPFSFWNTSDGGITWRKNRISIKHDQEIELVHQLIPLSKENLWLRGEKNESYYTEDGGKSWEKRNIEDSKINLTWLFFVSNKKGWGCTGPNGGIYRTEDGGKSWQRQNVSVIQPNLYSVFFIDENEGWTAGSNNINGNKATSGSQGLLLHTINGGNTWEKVEIPGNDDYYKCVHFSTSAQGWLISKDKVYRTNDKGKSWKKVFDISNE